jgi:hypothetical protein
VLPAWSSGSARPTGQSGEQPSLIAPGFRGWLAGRAGPGVAFRPARRRNCRARSAQGGGRATRHHESPGQSPERWQRLARTSR